MKSGGLTHEQRSEAVRKIWLKDLEDMVIQRSKHQTSVASTTCYEDSIIRKYSENSFTNIQPLHRGGDNDNHQASNSCIFDFHHAPDENLLDQLDTADEIIDITQKKKTPPRFINLPKKILKNEDIKFAAGSQHSLLKTENFAVVEETSPSEFSPTIASPLKPVLDRPREIAR